MDEVPVEELIQHIPGPDFPTGGVIVRSEGIWQAYSTGRGRIVLRGMAHIEDLGTNRHRIVITEIPYQLNKSSLLERIAELARGDKIGDISDLRDESKGGTGIGVRLVIQMLRDWK